MLRLYRIAPDVTTLGPNRRFCIWTQGCNKHCRGCMSQDTWDLNGGYCIDEPQLIQRMSHFKFEGITISGGEPFLQSHALSRLITGLRRQRETGVIVYTGMLYEELIASEDSNVHAFLEKIDLLIDGNYVAELDDDGAYRGSSNQRAYCLTDRYKQWVQDEFGKIGMRRQQLQIDEQGVLFIGLRSKLREERPCVYECQRPKN